MSPKTIKQPSKCRTTARISKSKKQRLKRGAESMKMTKADTARGVRAGLLPTSGPRARLSGKKARKREKKVGYALKRKMEAEGEAEMTDAPTFAADKRHDADETKMEGIE